MANSVKTITKDGAWVELTAGAAPATYCDFSNNGPASIVVQYAAAQPTAGAQGNIFKPGQGDKLTNLTRVWARTEMPNNPDGLGGSLASVFVEVV